MSEQINIRCARAGDGSILNRLIVLALAMIALGCRCRGDVSVTNLPFPGIACFSEVRPQPPMRLFIAVVDLTDPKVRLRASPGGPDPDGPGEWQITLMRPSRIAERENMCLVVNGDFFRARSVKDAGGTNTAYASGVWGAVAGPAATGGTTWAASPNRRPCLIVGRNRQVTIETRDRPKPGDWEVVAGNTMLVVAGSAVSHTNKTRHPRTAVGLDATRTRLTFLVVDGRRPGVSVGMNYDELAAEMIRLGCHQALNLDGGGSSVMALRDSATAKMRVLNDPSDGWERAVANVLGVLVEASAPPSGGKPPAPARRED